MSAFNPTKWEQRWCPACEREVAASRRRPGHALHCFLFFITIGLWFGVWLLMGLGRSAQPLRCAVCHTPTSALAQPSQVLAASDLQGVKAGVALQARNDYQQVIERFPQAEPVADRAQRMGQALRMGLTNEQLIEFWGWVLIFFPYAPFYLRNARRSNTPAAAIPATTAPDSLSPTSTPPPS
jgi:hypothetical protein